MVQHLSANTSTTKIFAFFGVLIAVLAAPLLVIYFVYPSILGRHTGLVQSSIVALFGAFFVALILDFTLRIRQQQAASRVAVIALAEASVQSNRLIDLFATVIKASSEEYRPTILKDLFGKEAAELFSSRLDLTKAAGTTGKEPWSQYLSYQSKNLREGFTSILQRYQMFLPEEVISSIARLRNNHLLGILERLNQLTQIDASLSITRHVINMPINMLEPLFRSLHTEVSVIEKHAKRLKSDVVPRFPNSVFRDDVSPKSGSARFEGEPGPPTLMGKEPPVHEASSS